MPIPTNLNHTERILLAHILNVTVEEMMINFPEMSTSQKSEFQQKANLLHEKYPLDYLLGEIQINNLQFIVTPDVLIPRPETEEWIQKLTTVINENLRLASLTHQEQLLQNDYQKPELELLPKSSLLVDIGCGSGLIGLSLAHLFRRVVLTDISKEALVVAQKNGLQNDITNTEYFECNLLEHSDLLQIIEQFGDNWYLVANLPYLPTSDKIPHSKTSVQFEPDQALYSGQFGLDIFQQIINQIKLLNTKPRIAVFELDPRNIRIAHQLLQRIYPATTIWKDGKNLERVLVGYI